MSKFTNESYNTVNKALECYLKEVNANETLPQAEKDKAKRKIDEAFDEVVGIGTY